MNKLLNLHINLFNFLRSGFKRKQTSKQLIYFLRNLFKSYFIELINLYRYFFVYILDTERRKEIKKYQQYRKEIANAWRIIQWMIKQGNTRTERKQLRRDFEKYGRISKELERAILKDLYGVK